MALSVSPTESRKILVGLLHLWRLGLLCAVLMHEREHPALAVLILVPLNHILFRLTSTLADDSKGVRPAAPVIVLYALASGGLVWWYGSVEALVADLKVFSATREWWGLVLALFLLTVLYRPLVTALGHFVGATGLRDSRLWAGLFLAIAVWVWCAGVFAGLYQQLSLLCDTSASELCAGDRAFSQPLVHYWDAAYFSTVTLSTAGYGDIVPVSQIARAMVSLEILIGFGLLGFLLSRVAGFSRERS
jgi:hypothetical protein